MKTWSHNSLAFFEEHGIFLFCRVNLLKLVGLSVCVCLKLNKRPFRMDMKKVKEAKQKFYREPKMSDAPKDEALFVTLR